MTTSGTYNYNPSSGEILLYAYNLIGIRGTALLQEHMEAGRMAMNMMLGSFSSQGVNLWKTSLETIPLVKAVAIYSIPSNTITMLDAYVTVEYGGITQNRVIMPISRTEYASYSQPEQQGFPTTFWFDRLLSPNVTLWPVPDGSQTSFCYYRLVQIQDSNFTNGQTVEIPYYFLECLAYGLAYRLALMWATEKAQMLKVLADESYEIAVSQNIETSQVFVSPILSGYYRV